MIRATSVLLAMVLFPSFSTASDLQWIEQGWRSNAVLTFQHNPIYNDLTLAERQARHQVLGKTIWSFKDGIFHLLELDGSESASAPYSVRSDGSDVFEITIYIDGDVNTFTINKVKGGFCAVHTPIWISETGEWTDDSSRKCFGPYDPGNGPKIIFSDH